MNGVPSVAGKVLSSEMIVNADAFFPAFMAQDLSGVESGDSKPGAVDTSK